jgi:hypothetical protein
MFKNALLRETISRELAQVRPRRRQVLFDRNKISDQALSSSEILEMFSGSLRDNT